MPSWMLAAGAKGVRDALHTHGQKTDMQSRHAGLARQVKDLEFRVDRLALLNQALWELLQERTGLSEADLDHKANEVDLRDGVADGRITPQPVRCPSCKRVSNSRHYRCLYCGLDFEKPTFG